MISGNPTADLLMAHSSVRQIKVEPVSEEIVESIIKCTQKAPTSSYLQAFTMIRVTDVEKRKALMEYSGGQEWVVKAPLVILFCADLYRVRELVHPADENVLHNAELFTVAVSDAALAAQRAFIAAQSYGLGGVVVGGVRNETAKMAQLFDFPELVFPMYLLCLGYPEVIPPQRPRFPAKVMLGNDAYPQLPTEEEMEAYNKEVSEYFLETTNGRSDRNWTSRAGHAISVKPRYNVGEFLNQAGFLTKTEPNLK